jgi:CIC family chloride channel protein
MPIYEALLNRDLARAGIGSSHQQPIVVEFEVEPKSRFAGLLVRQLGLPAGCVIVRCHVEGREWVPTAATRLEAHMRVTVVIAPDADGALELLRHGCTAERIGALDQ